MKTILYFQSSLNASNNSVLGGVSRSAKSANGKGRVTPYADAACLWGDRADGSGAAQTLQKPCDFHIKRGVGHLGHSKAWFGLAYAIPN